MAGDRAPSEHELVARFGVSRMTAHHALKSLSAEGFLTRIKGVGTFAAPPRAHVFEAKLQDVADTLAAQRTGLIKSLRAAPLLVQNLINAYDPNHKVLMGRTDLNELSIWSRPDSTSSTELPTLLPAAGSR